MSSSTSTANSQNFQYTPSGLTSAAGNNTNVTQSWSAMQTEQRGIPVGLLFAYVADQTDVVNQKLATLKSAGSSLSITDMFEMQMKMNRLSQISEMATAVVSAASGSITSIARNVKS